MYFWIINCLFAFLICIFCAGVVIPQILLVAFRKQLFDIPDERKIHHCEVPRLGGIAFKPVIFFTISLLAGINIVLGYSEMFTEIESNILPLTFLICSTIILYLVGIADDLIGIRYSAKFIVQILSGVMLVIGGIYIDNFYGLFLIHSIPLWLGYLFTVFIVVFIINSINLIDGIDGLASGLFGIASMFYGVIFYLFHQYIYAMLAFSTLGVLIPFFYYNVFGKAEQRRKIFMGDTGSLTIGLMLCFLSLKLTMCEPNENTWNIHPMVLAFSPLLIPCCDVVRVYLHRVRNGKNPFLPDKNHIHHKLLAIGMRQRTAMITIVSVSTMFVLFNIIISLYLDVNWIILGDVLVWSLANIWLSKRIKQLQSRQTTGK